MTLKIDFMPSYKLKNKYNLTNSHHTPVKDYLESRDFHQNRLWRLYNGILSTFHNGKWYSKEEFEEEFKRFNPVSLTLSKENSDKSREYLK